MLFRSLVDNDPWGYYIYSVVKQGSINLAFESQRMAIPDAKFIGLSSFDPEKHKMPRNLGIKLKDNDVTRGKELLSYPWFQKKEWRRELEGMTRTGKKYEIEALSRRGISFITEDYLPKKLADKDWLE